MITRSLLLAGAATLALTGVAEARTVDVPARTSSAIAKAHDAGLVVLLPSKIDLDYAAGKPLHADGSGSAAKRSYTISIGATRNCDGSACFLAEFTGRAGAKLGHASNVSLALGMKGYYVPLKCGASCAPASIRWVQKGVRYEIGAKALGGRDAFVKMADSAIRAGNRK